VFLQELIDGNQDIFLICPQFPVYVSLRDNDPDPDVTTPDSGARGVYVDHVLLLPRLSQPQGNVKLLEAFHRTFSGRNSRLYRFFDINTLDVPLLEEKKRAPTRHPQDLEAYVKSIEAALGAAQSQVSTQAKILFSSPRFATQDWVILVASSGEYYRLAVLKRGHRALSAVPTPFAISTLITNHEESVIMSDLVEELKNQLVLSPRSPIERDTQRRIARREAEEAEREKQKNAREARASARSKRQQALSTERDSVRRLSELVIKAGDPDPFYSDDLIEAYHKIDREIRKDQFDLSFQRSPKFFEPEPKPDEVLSTLANYTNNIDPRAIVFTGVIRIGSQTSNRFVQMIRQYLLGLAQAERSRRYRR
jgi:hypothetical protein